jgi:hypothetical protein
LEGGYAEVVAEGGVLLSACLAGFKDEIVAVDGGEAGEEGEEDGEKNEERAAKRAHCLVMGGGYDVLGLVERRWN